MIKTLLSSLLLAVTIGILAGCGETKTTSSTPDSTAVKTEMAKCDFCGTEVPKAELASHDGKMACKKCIEAHNH